jgi:hypothetical protein
MASRLQQRFFVRQPSVRVAEVLVFFSSARFYGSSFAVIGVTCVQKGPVKAALKEFLKMTP